MVTCAQLCMDPVCIQQAIAKHHEKTVQQVIFRFALQIGMTPLTGSSSKAHLQEDLEVYDGFKLSVKEMARIENAGIGMGAPKHKRNKRKH